MRLTLLKVALLAVNVLFAVLLVSRLIEGIEIAPGAIARVEPINLPGEMPASASYESIRAQAVFHGSRAYYVPPPPSATPRQPPEYKLVGSMSTPGKPLSAILLHTSSGVRARVTVGDELEGWRVEDVRTGRVVLRLGERTAEIDASSGTPAGGMTRVQGESVPDGSRAGVVRVLGDGKSRAGAAQRPPADTAPRLYRPPGVQRSQSPEQGT